eukprot:SAG31_NODE_13662_length_854_cov_1.888742_1_plen_33_part_01
MGTRWGSPSHNQEEHHEITYTIFTHVVLVVVLA